MTNNKCYFPINEPRAIAFNNTELFRGMSNLVVDDSRVLTAPLCRRKGREYSIVTMQLTAAVPITISLRDLGLLNSLFTAARAGVTEISAADLRRLYFCDWGLRPDPQKDSVIMDRLRLLAGVNVTIDRPLPNEQHKYYSGALLPVEFVAKKQESNGHPVTVATLVGQSPIFELAEDLRQVACVSFNLLDMREHGVKLTQESDEFVLLKRRILLRVSQIKNPKNKLKSDKIALLWVNGRTGEDSGLLAWLGYHPGEINRKHIERIRRNVEVVLTHLVNQGAIRSYTAYRRGNSTRLNAPIAGYCLVF